MSLLDLLTQKETWSEFLEYKRQGGNLAVKEERRLAEFVENGEYLPVASRLAAGETDFPVPEKKLINKMSGKKRVVYSFPYAESACLKLISYLLYRYDGKFSDNLYSFRRNVCAKTAVARLVRSDGISGKYCYKLDVRDYFNSIDCERLIEKLTDFISDDQKLLAFFRALLTLDKAEFSGEIITEKRGAMAGIPVSPFFANVYLSDLDRSFSEEGALYCRYSDDIVVFAEDRESLAGSRQRILDFLCAEGLTVNPDKESFSAPGEAWEFLGISYCGGEISLSAGTLEKIKGKIRRKARSIRRYKLKKGVPDEKAVSIMIKKFDKKFFDAAEDGGLTWSRWFFPLVTTADALREVDAYMQQYLRYIVSGKHNKANFDKLPYEKMKELGYRSLVNEYYKGKAK